MPGCLELAPKMTGSTSSGGPQPPKEAAPKAEHHQLRGKMTPRPESGQPGQPVQLTPLWEHVVRTRRFPMSVDAESTFREISDRLRDPEWEVRQHALRVLIDVLPVLEPSVVDKLMVSVVPELVTNLGHPAPAVRKGALDTLRVYLCYSQDKENMFQKILGEGFNRPDALDNFQSNVSMGVILSVPSLLFPSAGSPRPPDGVLRFAINSLASRLVQVTHQEAALRSLARIREIIGGQEFDSHMLDYNANVKRDFDLLCEVYNVKIYQDQEEKSQGEVKGEEIKEIVPLIKEWSSDTDSSGATDGGDEDEDQDDVLVGPMPQARVVLETEIKFDEETAITMTILEEKEKESEAEESDSSDSDFNAEDAGVVQVLEEAIPERRKTSRRVRFGGEIVKLRTPDSDEASIGKPDIPRTKIPLPLFPATKMPLDRRRSFSQPTSPTHSKHPKKRSHSSSPKREIYTHNALLSPKKSILTRPSSPVYVIQPVKSRREEKKKRKKKATSSSNGLQKNPIQLKEIKETPEADEISGNNSKVEKNDKLVNGREETIVLSEVSKETNELVKSVSEVQKSDAIGDSKAGESGKAAEGVSPNRESPKRSSRPSSHVNFDVFPKQERNYILMELSSPERKKRAEKKRVENESSNDFLPFGAVVSDQSFGTNISALKTEMTVPDQLLNKIIDNISTATSQTSGGSEATMTQRFPTTMKTDRTNTGDGLSGTLQELHSEKLHRDPRFFSNIPTVLFPRNVQSSREPVGQPKEDVKPTPTTANNQYSENDVDTEVLVDKNRSFLRELASYTRNGSTPDESESLTCSSSEGEGYSQEPSWEELGLVDQETLDDLHNKDDWRARVRGLERLASALKTSSALAAVEPSLGSLLQAVLGGERSCRIAAAGMAAARVVIAGVSEDALRRRLPQLAWGLTRQGGPHAAQLARIAMLRLRPALLLEQLLQPHCLGARNGKTRENALQLLIFSLVTFPSTEFKVQTVARRVAETVGDRRRRVRQAALDTLAVLGQIYETEEVLEAGERAASGRHDSEAMKAAIRSRLARKSLPLVSADGLVVYGLQISPNVRIATGSIGADVDWIVAGSGSLSPGSGRSRGQLIGMTARLDSASIFRSESARSNPWVERPDLVAVGIGVGSREQSQPFAWQFVPAQSQDDQRPKERAAWASEGRNIRTGISNVSSTIRPFYLQPQEPLKLVTTADRGSSFLNKNHLAERKNFIGSSSEGRLRLEEKLLKYCTTSNKCHDSVRRDIRSNVEVPSKYPQTANEYLRQRFYEFCREKARIRNVNPPPQEGTVNRSESRIPVLHTRERGTLMKEGSVENTVRRGAGVGEGARGGVTLNEIPRRITPGSSLAATDGVRCNKLEPQDTNVGYASMYQRRRRLVEGNAFQALQVSPDVSNQFSFTGQRYGPNGPSRKFPEHIDRDPRIPRGRLDVARESPGRINSEREPTLPEMGMINYQTVGGNRSLSHSSERSKRSKSRSQERLYDTETKPASCTPITTSTSRDTYGTMYQRRRRLVEGNAFLALQTSSNGTSYHPQQSQHYSQHLTERMTPPQITDRSSRAEAVRESVRKFPERDQGSIDIPTVNQHKTKIGRGLPISSEKRLGRPRSRSEENLLERNNEPKVPSLVAHNPAIRHLDKAVIDDEDYNVQRRASSRSSVYEIQSTSSRNSQYQVTRSGHDVLAYEGKADRPASADSSNSNISVAESHQSEIRRLNDNHQHSQDENHSSSSPASHNSRSSTPHSPRNPAFDVVPFAAVPSRRNSVNSYVLNSKRSNLPDESIALEISDEDSSSSDVEVDEQADEQSVQDKLSHDFENLNGEDDTDDTFESKIIRARDSTRVRLSSVESDFGRKISKESTRSTISSKKSPGSPRSVQSFQQLDEDEYISSSKQYMVSEESRKSALSNHSIDRILPRHEVSGNEITIQDVVNTSSKSSESFSETAPDIADEVGEAILSTVLPDDTGSIQSLGSRSFQELDRPELYSNSNSASMVRSSHSHSNADIEMDDDPREDIQSDHAPASPDLRKSKNTSRTPSVKDVTSAPQSPGVLLAHGKSSLSRSPESRSGIDLANLAASKAGQSQPPEAPEPSKALPSKVPRVKPKPRVNSMRGNSTAIQNVSKPLEKPKAIAQLCFTQLESKDWEVVVKGLKSLSQIARQNPAQLESCGPGTLGRVLGRHIRNLRSQVSRAACLAAGEVFMSQPKGIEQEIDDIAGPLLHRTADTNKFLRADSNTALDRLAENISPNKTIAVIIYRGALHQNAIVRATTGRLLSDIVNRIGPDQAMTLPRDVREKLLATGAKLLIDGNLDARNYAKKMFRALSHCEGFQKALTDAVPEATLRHIDKTLRSL